MTAPHPAASAASPKGPSAPISSAPGSLPQPKAAVDFLSYSDKSPTPWHATATSAAALEAAGFKRLKEGDVWDDKLERGGKYYFTRNQSALISFAVGGQYKPGNGIHIIGGHTDSPNLRLKPVSKKTKEGYLQVGVETYGGGIWASWWDKDLSIAGRVIVSDDESHKGFTSKLVHIKRPILRIPTLAIHLNRTVNEAFKFNPETEMLPILGLVDAAKDALNAPVPASGADAAVGPRPMTEKHHPALLSLLATELDVKVEQIQDFELCLYDVQPASLGGIQNEFIFAARLDNQMTCFCATEAMIGAHGQGSTLAQSSSIRAIALFDNEEVGSVSAHGAESNMLESFIKRMGGVKVQGAEPPHHTTYEQTISNSFLISSDMAHGFHPNYSRFYEEDHRPRINGGPVIKTNVKMRYATNAPTTFLLRRVAKAANVPLQEFVVRNDSPCGSTIGALVSKTGIRVVDIGNPQLSMHSIRETCGSHDVELKIRLFESFFHNFEDELTSLTID